MSESVGMERFAAEHGIPALLDHLGLDGLGNDVNALLQVAQAAEEYREAADWYRRCLEDVQDRQPVRGLGEAKAGFHRASDRLDAVLTALVVSEQKEAE